MAQEQEQVKMVDDGSDKMMLELESMTGFNGAVSGGLMVHPDRQHLIYPVGCTVIIEDIKTKKQSFLSGHTDTVTCLTISKKDDKGKYIASGQKTHMGFKADVIIWDYYSKCQYACLTLHKGEVAAMSFSPNDKYLVTLGGSDDGSVVVWDIAKRAPICGAPAQVMSAGKTNTITYSHKSDDIFVTGGDNTLRVWELNVEDRKIRPTEVNMGNMKRVIKCIEFDENDSNFYCGTTTGDILAINMNSKNFQVHGPKQPFSLGVTGLMLLTSGDLLVGTGDGTVCICKGKDSNFKKTNKEVKLQGAVTSIALRGKGHQFYVGTDQCNIYCFNFVEFKHELISTCHFAEIFDVTFPFGYSDLYVTCSYQDIRCWGMSKNQELLRITVPNMTCHAVQVMRDGKSIITGWDDGRIRAFKPESGCNMYTITDAHKGGVTALASFSDSCHIVSGGKEGNVRVWEITRGYLANGKDCFKTALMFSLQEHKAEVTAIQVNKADTQCVSSSRDGSCIIWDLQKKARCQMIHMNTLFKFVCYHPEEHQIITTGTDRKIGYFETFDGSTIRALDGSSAPINCLDITADGKYFASGGEDKLVKVWDYDDGTPNYVGVGHSATITRVKICPARKYILSVSTDGAILRWKFPY